MSESKALAVASPSTTTDAPNWLLQNWGRLAQIGIGHSLYGTFNHFIDYVVYPYVVYQLGVFVGGAVMTTFSLVQCALTLVAYERFGIDWVGAGLIHDIARKQHRHQSLFEKTLAWTTQQNKVVMFFTLSALTDPFIITAYFRGGAFDGLRQRDWCIFFASVLACNLYWIVVADLIAHGVAALWTALTTWI